MKRRTILQASAWLALCVLSVVLYGYGSGTAPVITIGPPHDDASNGIHCGDCHSIHSSIFSFNPQGAEQEALCKSCHNPTGVAAALSDVANHVVNGGSTIIDCGACHDPHSPDTSLDPRTGIEAENLSLIRNQVKDVPGALTATVFQVRPRDFAFDVGNGPYNGVCQTCHTQTDYHRNDDPQPMGMSHRIGSDCTCCHQHGQGFAPPESDAHPQSTEADCNICHVNRETEQPDLQFVHNYDCQLCHGSECGPDWSTFLGPVGTWNNQCTQCHNPTVAETGNYPTPTKYHRCMVCHDRKMGNRVQMHYRHSKRADCSVCHGFIPDTNVEIGSGNRENCELCHGEGAYQDSDPLMIHHDMNNKLEKTGKSCIECHDERPPVDVVPGPPVGGVSHVCQLCHTDRDPSEFQSNMEGLHEEHTKHFDCSFCHIDAVNQDDRYPFPPKTDSRRGLVDRAGYNECAFCHTDGRTSSIQTAHKKHVSDQWQWCYNCHEDTDLRPTPEAPPATRPPEACYLCHDQTYTDSYPFAIHKRHAKKAKCSTCHLTERLLYDWPDEWRQFQWQMH